MIVVTWILLIVFGIFAFSFIRKFYLSTVNIFEAILMILSIVVSALSAGYLFGGLTL